MKDICEEVHRLLEALPTYTSYSAVPFDNGLYFLYQTGEASEHAPLGRVVRVGNHPRSDNGLARRLRQHYSGQKNGSVFRKLLGGALIRSRDPNNACLAPAPGKGHWEKQHAKVCSRCASVEQEVSALLRSNFRFRCVRIDQRAERGLFEALLIGTLSLCPACKPSDQWLGVYAYSDHVQRSGLWNSQFVYAPGLTGRDLQRFAELVRLTKETARGLS